MPEGWIASTREERRYARDEISKIFPTLEYSGPLSPFLASIRIYREVSALSIGDLKHSGTLNEIFRGCSRLFPVLCEISNRFDDRFGLARIEIFRSPESFAPSKRFVSFQFASSRATREILNFIAKCFNIR